jgi:hypothetical protein
MRRHIFAIIGALLLAGSASAQKPPDSWDNLKQLVPGEAVRVVLNDAKSYQGKFELVSDEAITVRLAAAEQSFARQDILRVSAKGDPHRMRNALIGAGIGAGVAGALAAKNYHNDPESGAYAVALGIPFAAVAGAGVGAVMPTGGWHDIYRARSSATRAPRRQAGP